MRAKRSWRLRQDVLVLRIAHDEDPLPFTLADHGSHTFVGAVTFGKGGAETLQVTQANNHEVRGKSTFAIG